MKKVKDEHKIICIAFILGTGIWIADAFVDSFFFFEGSFIDSLIFHVSGHELYFRFFFLFGFIAFGVIISRFITKRKKTEQNLNEAIGALKAEKARSDEILSAIGDPITIQDTNFRVMYQNQAHIEMAGSHLGEYCFSAYQGKDSVCKGCHLARSFMDGTVQRLEQSRTSGNGKIYYEVTASPLRDSTGNIIGGIEVARDITARKITERLIELSKQDWENTFDTIDDIITIHDKDFNIIRANKAAEKMLGKPIREIIKSKCFTFYHGGDSPPEECPSCDCMSTGKSAIYEFFEPHLNKFLEIKAIPRFGSENNIEGVIHIVRDITDRKQIEAELINHREHLANMVQERTAELTSANERLKDEIFHSRQIEEALRISETTYKDLYDNAPDMYHSLNRDKIIIDCNETEARMLGYRKDEIIGRPLSDFLTEDSGKLLERDFPRIKKKKVLKNLERNFIRKDGTIFPAILNVFAEFDEKGELERTRAIGRDITELKEKEKDLKKLNSTLKTLSECNYALLHITGESELLKEICRIIVETGGYEMAWVGYAEHNSEKNVRPVAHSGNSDGYLDSIKISWDKSETGKGPTGKAIRTGITTIARNIPTDSNFSPWRSMAADRGYNSSIAIPLFDSQKIIGSLNIYAREADAFDSDAVDLLEKLAANLSYGISAIRSNMERKRAETEALRAGHLASLGELAAGVAHEINNPINGILNYAQILANKGPDGSREMDIAKRIIKESDRIANIVSSLLSFARDSEEEKKPILMQDIMADALALTEAQMKKEGIKLEVNLPHDLPKIIAQSQQIEQVFLNLISNARYALNKKYPKNHNGKILVITGESFTDGGKPFVRLTFHDRGTGIPSSNLDKIVNPFFSTKPANVGTGLGLSISHGIINDHGGKLTIDSIETEYTKIIIELPEKGKSNGKSTRY
jgi:PAS domain S-box-containing protein